MGTPQAFPESDRYRPALAQRSSADTIKFSRAPSGPRGVVFPCLRASLPPCFLASPGCHTMQTRFSR